jgi:hypothetical protein
VVAAEVLGGVVAKELLHRWDVAHPFLVFELFGSWFEVDRCEVGAEVFAGWDVVKAEAADLAVWWLGHDRSPFS